MKYCTKCEGQLIEGLKYCFHCGADVKVSDCNNVKNNETEKEVETLVNEKNSPKSRLDTRLFDII